MDSTEYREQLRRINTFNDINKELDDITNLIDTIDNLGYVKLSFRLLPELEYTIRDSRGLAIILKQLNSIKTNLIHERDQI